MEETSSVASDNTLWKRFGKPLLWAVVIIFGMSFLGMFAKIAYVKWLVYQSVQNMEEKAERDERGRRLDGDLYVPANYFELPQYDYSKVKNVKVELLTVLWPGLEPRTADNRTEFSVPGGGRRLSIRIDSVADVAPERRQRLLDLHLEGKLRHERYDMQGIHYSLEKLGNRFYIRPQGVPNAGTPVERQSDDIFFLREQGKVRSLLECAPEPPQFGVRSPSCRHVFIIDDLDVETHMHYRREYLPEWRRIETEVAALIRSFYQQPAAADKEE
jgi:hypothetical protein